MTPEKFIEALLPHAIASERVTNVPASFSIAQAAIESAWGRSGLAKDAKNLFGVKASSSWTGETITLPTREYVNGHWVTEDSIWRKYADWKECFDDHGKLLHGKRYSGAFATTNSCDFARVVAKAGYSTDPAYAEKIINIITHHNLTQYDNQEPVPAIETINIEPVERRSEHQSKEEELTSRIPAQTEDVSRGTSVKSLQSFASTEAVRVFSLVTWMQFTLTAAVIAGVVGLMAALVYKSSDGEIPAWAVGIANALVVVVALEWRNIIHAIVGKDATLPEK